AGILKEWRVHRSSRVLIEVKQGRVSEIAGEFIARAVSKIRRKRLSGEVLGNFPGHAGICQPFRVSRPGEIIAVVTATIMRDRPGASAVCACVSQAGEVADAARP